MTSEKKRLLFKKKNLSFIFYLIFADRRQFFFAILRENATQTVVFSNLYFQICFCIFFIFFVTIFLLKTGVYAFCVCAAILAGKFSFFFNVRCVFFIFFLSYHSRPSNNVLHFLYFFPDTRWLLISWNW